jgi:hypothetical protein
MVMEIAITSRRAVAVKISLKPVLAMILNIYWAK